MKSKCMLLSRRIQLAIAITVCRDGNGLTLPPLWPHCGWGDGQAASRSSCGSMVPVLLAVGYVPGAGGMAVASAPGRRSGGA